MEDVPYLFNEGIPFPKSMCPGVSWNILWELNSAVGHRVIRTHRSAEKGNKNTSLTFDPTVDTRWTVWKEEKPTF